MTRRRFDLTDFEWSFIQPLLPNKPRSVPRVGDRRVINAILIVVIDSSCVRVHQHAAKGKRGIKTMAAWDVPVAA